MRGKSVLILAIVVILLAAFAWFVDRPRPGSQERRRTADLLLALDADRVTKVSIDGDDDLVVLERQADGTVEEGEAADSGEEKVDSEWWLRQPIEARADAAKVNGLLTALTGLDRQRRLEDAEPAQYGLEEPRWDLTLEADDEMTEVAVGSELPGLDSVAVRVDGGAIELVPSPWLERLHPEGTGWRSPKLFWHPRDDIQAVRVEGGDTQVSSDPVSLERTGDRFRIVEPIDDLADRSLVDALLAAIVGLTAEEYVEALESEDTPASAFTVTLTDGAGWSLRLGGDGHAIAGGEGVRVEEPVLQEAAARSAEDWRSRAWSPVDGYEVDAAVFVDAGGETRIEKVEGDWQRDGEPIGFSAATGPLYAMSAAEAEEFLPPGAVADLQPVLEASLTSDGATRELRLFDRPEAEGCAATVDDRSVVLALPAEACDEVKDELAALREAEPIGAQTTQPADE